MASKLRIRIGDVEIDYDGTEEFLKLEMAPLLKTAMELHKAAGPSLGSRGPAAGGDGQKDVPALTTSSIAARLKAQSGPDLLLAAAAHLTFVAKKESFSRQELLAEMKTATAYYKKSYSNNLSKSLTGAVTEKKLAETATNTYALSANARADLEKRLADA